MPIEQTQPTRCPICGSDQITQILCDTLLSAHFRGMQCPSEGVVAYHCEGGHVFLLLRSDFSWGQPTFRDVDSDRPPERSWSLATVLRKGLVSAPVSPLSIFWFLLAVMLQRRERFQTLQLIP